MPENIKKGAEAKLYPNTGITLASALAVAKRMNDHLGASSFLTQKTIDRLNAIEPLYRQTRLNIRSRKAEQGNIIVQKEKARVDTALYTSHFIQVFILGVKRGKYSFSDRAFFHLTIESDEQLTLKGEDNIRAAAENVIAGEAKRIAAGSEAVINPSAAEVQAKYNLLNTLTVAATNAKEALRLEQKTLRALHKEARAVVKKVWQEVEIYHSEGGRERMRKLAREWGVHYARKGGEKTVKGTITDAATGLPLGAVKVKFAKGKNKVFTGSDGRFSLVTNLLHSQKLIASRDGYNKAEVIIELKEGEESFCEVKMVKEV